MQEPWSSRWHRSLPLAIGTTPGLMVLVVAVVNVFAEQSQGSLEGVLRAAQGFADLGDHGIVEQCIRVARSVAARSRDPRAEDRVRIFAERWAARALEADHLGFVP